jgi:hypothetical protein
MISNIVRLYGTAGSRVPRIHMEFSPPSLPKSEYFLQQHWESEYFFRKKP